MNFEKPHILQLTGSSGTGKSSIIREIQQRNKFERFLGDTTRIIRENEINNPEYNHISKNDFLAKFNGGGYIEPTEWHIEYNNEYYGTPNSWIGKIEKSEQNLIIAPSNVYSAKVLKSIFPSLICWVHLTLSENIRQERILKRSEISEEELSRRVNTGDTIGQKSEADYNLDTSNQSVQILASILLSFINKI